MEKEQRGLTKTIAQFIVGKDGSEIPLEVYEHTKLAFLDWMACEMAGKDEPLVLKLLEFTDLFGGHEQATVLGHGVKRNLGVATLINGCAGHALDSDDTMRDFPAHLTVTIFPAILAYSEWKERSGIDFMNAYIIGLNVGALIGACTGMAHYLAGWHPTSTIGRIASTAACAKLMGLDENQTLYALGIAGTQASGLRRVFGTMTKPFHAGRASQVGLEASLLAKEGFTSAVDIFEGPDAFLQVMTGQVNEEAVGLLDNTWAVEAVAQKYHASAHCTHSAIEASMAILNKEGLRTRDIKSIKLYVSELTLSVSGSKPESLDPQTGLDGKFSMSYVVANALLRGDTGIAAFTDRRVHDPEIREFMKKISMVVDEEKVGDAMGIIVEIETHSGQIYSRFCDIMQEIPDLRTKKVKLKDKFIDLGSPVLGEQKTEDLMESILSLEKQDNMKRFVQHEET